MALIKSRKINDPALKLAGDPAPEMLVTITDKKTGKTRTTELQNAVKYSGISLSSGIIGQADKTTVPDDSTNKFIKYSIPNDEDHVGIYPNFLDELGNPLEVIDDDPENEIVGDLSLGIVEFWGQNNIWRKNITGLPLSGFTKTGGYYGTAQDLQNEQVDNYQFKYFVQNIKIASMSVNGATVSDSFEIKKQLVRIDKSISNLGAFNLPENIFLILRQFTISATGVAIGFSEAHSATEEVDYSGSSVIWFDSKPKGGIVDFQMNNIYRPYNVLVSIDTDLFGPDLVTFNTQNVDHKVSYKLSGINRSSIKELPYIDKPFWRGTFVNYISRSTNRSDNINMYNAFKDFIVQSKDAENDRLLALRSIGYDGNTLVAVMWSCIDDDPENLNITTDRTGFQYYRFLIPITDTGVKRYESFAPSGTEDLHVTAVVYVDALFANVPDKTQFSVSSTVTQAQFLVKKKLSSSGSGGHFTQLDLIGPDNFEDIPVRFTPTATNFVYGAGNEAKLVKIPVSTVGQTTLDFICGLNGSEYNVSFLDKNMLSIDKAYDGSEGEITQLLGVVPPAGAVFFKLITNTDKASVKVIAHGDFDIDLATTKEYRCINEGLSDKYSGQTFTVIGKIFKKIKNDICNLKEYTSGTIIGGLLDSVPIYQKNGDYIIPDTILHTDGVHTYKGGILCAIKYGIMYFYNAKYCAIYKSEDGGATYTTIVDKYSNPDLWDLIDTNTESRSVIVPLDDGEILFQVRHRGDIPIPGASKNERFYVLCKTTGGQTDAEIVLTFSHEDTANTWDPTKPNWPNHSGGCMLSDFCHATLGNMIVVTEYGAGASKYWSLLNPSLAGNARGVSARAWVSFDYGVTWKKMFDADRKKIGTAEADDNWFYFTSTNSAKMRHMHGIDIDPIRRVVHITNGDHEDYIWSCSIDAIKAWYDTAPAVDPNEKPIYAETDTFPEWDIFLNCPAEGLSNNAYGSMRSQMMKSFATEMGWSWIHDASREMLWVKYKNNGEDIMEPVFNFENRADFDTDQAFAISWGSTDAFVQGLTQKNGVNYLSHSNSDGRPSRIWATHDGVTCKKVYEGATDDIKFGGRVIFSDIDDSVYLSDGTFGQSSDVAGYWKLKTAA